MLFDDKLLFIHTPKCAGMAVTKFLIDNSPHGVTVTAPKGHAESESNATALDGTRHETLLEAAKRLAEFGRRLNDFELIVSIMRNPYDLEVSYYHYKRLGHPWDAGRAQRLAMAGDFVQFALKAPFYGRLPAGIEDWYEIDGKIPANLKIVRFESLESDLTRLLAEVYPIKRHLEKVNTTTHEAYREYLSYDSEEAIYRKYRWLFDKGFYQREPMTPAGPRTIYFQLPGAAPIKDAEHLPDTDGLLTRLQNFRQGGSEKLRGRLAPVMFDVLAASVRSLDACGIRGAIYEIGVFDGKFFLAMDQLRRAGEAAVAIDVFDEATRIGDAPDERDTDLFFTNVKAYSSDRDSVTMVNTDSTKITPSDIALLLQRFGPAKMISMDGGRTVEHVTNDLRIAEQLLERGGLAFVANFFTMNHPGVTEAVVRYMLSGFARLSPILFAGGKLVLTTVEQRARVQSSMRDGLLQQDIPTRKRALFGDDVLVAR